MPEPTPEPIIIEPEPQPDPVEPEPDPIEPEPTPVITPKPEPEPVPIHTTEPKPGPTISVPTTAPVTTNPSSPIEESKIVQLLKLLLELLKKIFHK